MNPVMNGMNRLVGQGTVAAASLNTLKSNEATSKVIPQLKILKTLMEDDRAVARIGNDTLKAVTAKAGNKI